MFSKPLRETDMPEWSLIYLKKSDFGGMRSRRAKRKPNQLFVYDIAIQCFDFPRGLHFNKLPVQLIMEIFKYLRAYELLRNVSLVCKYWYNLCRDRALWTSITWNGSPRTLGHLLKLTKYQVHELCLTNNLFTFSDKALALLLKKCTHLKCLKLPRNTCREIFKRELPRTNIIIGRISNAKDREVASTSVEPKRFYTLDESLAKHSKAKDIEITLTSVEYKRFDTLDEFLGEHIKDEIYSDHTDIQCLTKLRSLQRNHNSKSVRVYDKIMKTPDRPCIRKSPLQDCRTNRRQHLPIKIKPRPPKGRNNHHKKVRRFRGLRKRFKIFSLS